MPDNEIRGEALDRLCRRKRELDNAKAPFPAAPWDKLDELYRASYRAAMEPFVEALGDMLHEAPRVITTVEELDALPDSTIVIQMSTSDSAQKFEDVWEFPNVVGQHLSDAINLPATVLWEASDA